MNKTKSVQRLTPNQVAEQIKNWLFDGQNFVNCDYASQWLKVLDFGNEYYAIKHYYCDIDSDSNNFLELYFIHNKKRYYYGDCLKCDGWTFNTNNIHYE